MCVCANLCVFISYSYNDSQDLLFAQHQSLHADLQVSSNPLTRMITFNIPWFFQALSSILLAHVIINTAGTRKFCFCLFLATSSHELKQDNLLPGGVRVASLFMAGAYIQTTNDCHISSLVWLVESFHPFSVRR